MTALIYGSSSRPLVRLNVTHCFFFFVILNKRLSAEIETVHQNGQVRCFNFEHCRVAVAIQPGLGTSAIAAGILHLQPSLRFTQNGSQNGKRVSSSSLVKNTKMMLVVQDEKTG